MDYINFTEKLLYSNRRVLNILRRFKYMDLSSNLDERIESKE